MSGTCGLRGGRMGRRSGLGRGLEALIPTAQDRRLLGWSRCR